MSVNISLSEDEAVVLFDFLSRSIDEKDGSELRPAIEHDGELWALNAALGHLQKTLTLPFDADYDQGISLARKNLVQHCGDWPR